MIAFVIIIVALGVAAQCVCTMNVRLILPLNHLSHGYHAMCTNNMSLCYLHAT